MNAYDRNGNNGMYNDLRTSNVNFSGILSIQLEYSDRENGVYKSLSRIYKLRTTIREILTELITFLPYRHKNINEIVLTKIRHEGRCSTIYHNLNTTLLELSVADRSVLYFEPKSSFNIPEKCSLTIYGPNNKIMGCNFEKSNTTLSILFNYIIEIFNLESIERTRIHLFALGIELDLIKDAHTLLCDVGIQEDSIINVSIIPPISDSTVDLNVQVDVECEYKNETFHIKASIYDTMDDLKEKIQKKLGNRLYTNLLLYDKRRKLFNVNDVAKRLYDMGVGASDRIYVRLDVDPQNASSKENFPSSSTLDREQINVVIIFADTKKSRIEKTILLRETVGNLVKMVENLTTDQPVGAYSIMHGSTSIDMKYSEKRLSDLGIEPNGLIHIVFHNDGPTRNTPDNSRFSKFSAVNTLSKTLNLRSNPIGLYNFGNTCFMNSALQCLAHTEPLTQFLLGTFTQQPGDSEVNIRSKSNVFNSIGPVTDAYTDMLKTLWLEDESHYSYGSSYYTPTFEPARIKEIIGNLEPHFASWEQQDAQEFMTLLLNEMAKELKEKSRNQSITIIDYLFFGNIESVITCNKCKHKEVTTNPTNLLSLPLDSSERIFQIKFIDKYDKPKTDEVTVPNDGIIGNVVYAFSKRYPYYLYEVIVMAEDRSLHYETKLRDLPSSIQVLTLIERENYSVKHLYDYAPQARKLTLESCLKFFFEAEQLEDAWPCPNKNCKESTFATKQLRLSSFPEILVIQLKRFSHSHGWRQKVDTFVEYPINGLNLEQFSPSTKQPIYDLFGVINHTGSISSGHYTAIAKRTIKDRERWYKFDDSYVTTVINEYEIVSDKAYILFYIKRRKQ